MSKSSELIYTSAPQGLRPGSRGFCTVAMSESMPAGLVGPLESMSAYRHIDGDGPSPVNFMHVQMKVAGRPVNVLSRIGDAPPDYTGRTNKIAHYIVVATSDRAAGGPASVLRQPGFAIETWDGEVRKIPEPKTIPATDSSPRIAQTWAEQSGDAGWAGIVASIFDTPTPGAPLYLIYRPEQNAQLLAMVDEAICLLPESKRWNATFSTHTGELPPGVTCRLRCLIAGSAEASALPPSAMTLDIASGNLGSPHPGPLVEAARTGHLVSTETVPLPKTPTTSGQPGVPVAANPSALFETNEPGFDAPPPVNAPPFEMLSPTAEPQTSSTRNYVWPLLAVAALLLISLGGAAMYLLQTDSDGLLAELNASAGIENPPVDDLSPKSRKQPGIELEPEPEMESDVSVDSQADAKAAELKESEAKKRRSLEALAKKVLEGDEFLSDESEKSINKFADRVKRELQLISEQNKQLSELSLQPTDAQFAEWVRATDGAKQLTSFIDTRKKNINTLKQHPPLKDFEDYRERLADDLKTWNVEAKKWEKEYEKQSETILQIPNNFSVTQMITKVRATAKSRLQQSMSGLLDRYAKVVTEKNQNATSIEKQLDPLQKELVADLKRRRDSHRLAIYFDGNSRRKEDRFQIKPRCVITLNQDDLKSINRFSVDNSNPISLSQVSGDVKLPGRFEGWLGVMRTDTGVVIKLNPWTILPRVRDQHPILVQLDQFVHNQDAAIKSDDILRALASNFNKKVNDRISDLSSQVTATDLQEAQRQSELNKAREAQEVIAQMTQILSRPPVEELDGLYIKQADQMMNDLRSVKSKIVEVFQVFAREVPIGPKIDEHIANLESLRDSYRELKANTSVLDFEGQLVFGNSSGSQLGQSTFQTIETFELFFFPELVYGPPPRE